jgi:squalene-hopene/tetraprenyl-beta-curcumene cyclase
MIGAFGLMAAQPALALDDAHREKAERAIAKAVKYLREAQNDDGSWTPKPGPAVTGLVVAGLLRSPEINSEDPQIAKALGYILKHQQEDGGIYDKYLKNYNTSICLMALGQADATPGIRKAIANAHDFLRELQWTEGKTDPAGNKVTENHPYFGGAGYNDSKHGRPDGSNTFMMLTGLYDSGFDCTDPLYQNAIVYASRLQGAATNDMFARDIVNDGGFIYATSINRDHIGTPQTRTDEQYEKIKAGDKQEYDGPLPTYGSMSYAGYMSFLYAQLDRKDPRVTAARSWISNNFTTKTHPNMGERSYYYYMHFLSRALRANGEENIATSDGKQHDWANEVIDALVERQREDGSWINPVDRWMEGDPNLVTAYSLIALQVALGR